MTALKAWASRPTGKVGERIAFSPACPVQVNVQLIDTETGAYIWAERFELTPGNTSFLNSPRVRFGRVNYTDSSAAATAMRTGEITMRLRTRLTDMLGIEHPILLAPMNVIAGGKLAAAVTGAGGLGLIGGGYGDADWLERQYAAAGNARVGCGFITWSMARNPALLDQVLAKRPAALMLSFGELGPHASRIKARGVPLICQFQGMKYLREAVDAGADIVVAEGCEAGGHSGYRGVFTLVPEAADYLAQHSPDTVLVAAGGVGDGRGLAAALMLGADGVLVGTRFVAAEESEAPEGFREAIIRADGDSTMKSRSVDVARKRYWPNPEFVVRVLNNGFVARWHGREQEMESDIDVVMMSFWNAFEAGDADNSGVLTGEASGIIRDSPPAAGIIESMIDQACQLLGSHSPFVIRS